MSIVNDYILPFVIEKLAAVSASMTSTAAFEDRIVFIGEPIDDQVANSVIAQLLFLQKRTRARTSTCS